ncbi:dipeptide/oligopeptide/nickel ABC transporter ATP-binding protein [Klebsiella pneumoniae]|nr:dipeptide/oligopeptide/nickel ABC transporter ATP-binding protein [Klebsiella pneumoniae]
MSERYVIEVDGLKKYFPLRDGLFGQQTGELRAVDGVSFNIRPGTIFGLVGESGSGKTTVGRTLLGLYEKSAGSVKFHGQELADLTAPALRAIRPRMQLVFQDPYSSLNPRLRIGEAIGEAMLEHKLCARNELYDRVIDVMKICGLAPEHYARFPHQFSGGQRQRIGIARALILNPDFIVADEPISALDVSIQAQIINLFSDLRDNRGVTFLFISHDLGVVEHLCDDVAVMYLGQLVESASRDALFSRPPPSLYPRPDGCGADPRPAQRTAGAGARRDPGSGQSPPPAAAFHPAARWPANVAAESLRRCARWPRAIGSPVIGSHPERGQWGYLFLNNRPIVRGSARIYYPPRLVRRAINEAEHLCTLLPNGFGHFFSTPGSDPPGKIFSGARSPVCQNAAMELLVRVPLPFSRR